MQCCLDRVYYHWGYSLCLFRHLFCRFLCISSPPFAHHFSPQGVFRPIFEGLARLHDDRIVHNDLKCENVVVFKDAAGALSAKLVDFGCAAFLGTATELEAKKLMVRRSSHAHHKIHNSAAQCW